MKESRFREEQEVGILREVQAGAPLFRLSGDKKPVLKGSELAYLSVRRSSFDQSMEMFRKQTNGMRDRALSRR